MELYNNALPTGEINLKTLALPFSCGQKTF